jgi:hypothetical protein
MTFGRKLEFESSEESHEPLTGRKIELSKSEVSRLRSLLSAFPKGVIKGEGGESLLPKVGGVPHQLGERVTEHFLPTHNELPENILERSGKILRSTIGGGGSMFGSAVRALVGGIAGQLTEEAGGGQGIQAAAEIASQGLPALGRKIIPTKAQEKIVNFARKAGMREEQIAPLLSGDKKRAFFGKVASKGEKTQKALKESKQGISDAYEFVKGSPEASQSLTRESGEKFLRDSADIAKEIPFEIRKQLHQDALDLVQDGFSGKNLINWYQDISSRYKLGREHLERLKKPVTEALDSISPELAEDFKLTNELFKKRLAIGKTLKPSMASELMDLGELGKLAHDTMNMSMKGLTQLLGVSGARRLAREMLINPRLQNISKQMAKATNERKFTIALQLADYVKKKYGEDQSPQVNKQ